MIRTRSLQTRLTLCLATVMLAAAAIAGAVSYRTAFHEVNELQDDQLRQMSALAERRHGGTRAGLQDLDNRVVDVGARILVQLLHRGAWGEVEGGSKPLPLPAALPDGLQVLELQGTQWHLFLRTLPGGDRIAVSQSTAVRDEVARNASKTTIVPIAILIPVLGLAIILLVRHMLSPVMRLAAELDRRDDDRLLALDDAGIPSEIRPFIAAINRLLQRVELTLTQQKRFVADAAHELRTPLTAVSLQAELLARLDLDEPSRQQLLALQRGVLRARHLVGQLLLLARLQGSSQALPPSIPVHTICQQVLEDLLPLAEKKNITLSADVSTHDSIRSSVLDLGAVLRNLVDNAIRYNRASGQVDVIAFHRNGCLTLCVSDDGPGIPASERALVLSPFYRGKQTTESGSGLGLAIVHNVVQRMGGAIALETSMPDGRGLLVRVSLPLRPAEPGQSPIPMPAKAGSRIS